jgi:flagellin
VSKQAGVTGVAAAFTISALANADIATLAGANSPISISDGTTTITVTTTGPDDLGGTDTLANLVTVIQAKANYSAFKYTVTANSTTGLLLTSKTLGLATEIPSVSGNTTHAIANSVAGTDAISEGLVFTYESARKVLSNPTITADDGGFDIANALTEVTAGFTAVKSVYGRDITGLSIATDTNANTALAELDAAMDGINAQRAIYGAGMNRLEYAIDNLSNGSQNAAASRSRIEDADYAVETTELARTQIIQQAGTAMLAQANQSNQSVLSLLKG